MINDLAMHRLAKLRSSKIIWVFAGACIFLGMFFLLPVALFSKMAKGMPLGEGAAIPFFMFVDFMGHLAALILGVTVWRLDSRDGTLLTFAARPIARIELLVGKILGSLYGLVIYLAIAVAVYAIVHLVFFNFHIPAAAPLYLLQLLVSWMSTLALGLLFSNLGNPLMAAFLGVIYWFLGKLGNLFVMTPIDVMRYIGKAIRFISIDNDQTYALGEVLRSDLPSMNPILQAIAYYGLWALLLFTISIILFNRREFIGKRS